MRINQNIMAFNAFRNLSQTNQQLGGSLEKLSSGFRINRAADDAAGLVVSEGLRAQISGLRVATRNAQDGVSVVQTAEGALTEVHNMLRRMRDLALQASNTGANDEAARAAAQAEVNQLTAEVERISTDTKFGQVQLLDGTYGVTTTNASLEGASVARAGLDFDTGTDRTMQIAVGDGDLVNVTFDADWDGLTTDQIATNVETAIRNALVTDGQADAATLVSVTGVVDPANNNNSIFTIEVADGQSFELADGIGGTAQDGAAAFGWVNGTEVATTTGTGGVFQVGANSGETIGVTIRAMSASALSLGTGSGAGLVVDLDLENDAAGAVDLLDDAIKDVSEQRGALGAIQNRFENTIANLSVTTENLAASESRIRDTDMALELVSFTRHQILQQAGTAMLAQANQVPQSVLSLLR